nr:cysteine-rich with EGF-like domain protein 2 [Parasteatoda tepidariorum]
MGICQYCYCGDNSMCALNVDGTKNCSCPSGYRDVNGFCTEINECEEGIATCLSSEVCKNIYLVVPFAPVLMDTDTQTMDVKT